MPPKSKSIKKVKKTKTTRINKNKSKNVIKNKNSVNIHFHKTKIAQTIRKLKTQSTTYTQPYTF